MSDASSKAPSKGSPSRVQEKLTGRAFYESIGSPKMVLAPMVDRSEFAWRLLTRSFLEPEASKTLLAYSPMLHSRLFRANAKFRDAHFQPTRDSLVGQTSSSSTPWLDGNPQIDRPLFVQFCSNNPEDFLDAARYVAPYCDAVDLNLGCPQGIARTGHYGAFLQEDWTLIYKLINKLHMELPVPVTAKFRILESKERTLEYAKMILSAGASIITVHGRRREQKSQNMGIADWSYIRYLRDNLPPDTVIFANGNILNRGDLQPCLDQTGADGVMSAEGNLSDPTIFAAPPPLGLSVPEYWRGHQGQEGYRLDAVIRRYLDIIYRYILEMDPPKRLPLFLPSDPPNFAKQDSTPNNDESGPPPKKKQKRDGQGRVTSPSLKALQGHLFQLLRPILSTHTDIRDALAKCRVGEMAGFERVLRMVEDAMRQALIDDACTKAENEPKPQAEMASSVEERPTHTSASETTMRYKRPWWVCQPYIRPLPEEAVKSGALTASKKNLAKTKNSEESSIKCDEASGDVEGAGTEPQNELPKEALVCG